jgi:Flp pilus assembly protein TadD
MHVTPAMHQFAVDAAGSGLTVSQRVHKLVMATIGPHGIGLQYDALATLGAEQAFQQHRVNCLSYALLFVALARDVGIPAQFNEVDIPPVWDIGDDQTVLLYKHINIKIDLGFSLSQIVDVSGDEYDPSYPQEDIPDSSALAQFFNNRAVEMRMQQRYQDALRYQLRSVQMAPQIDYLWANLADLYSMAGNPRAARIAINQALMLDPGSMMDYNTAAGIYQRMGDTRKASFYGEHARSFLERNPYYHYQLALNALRARNSKTAGDEIHKAIEIQPREHRFYFLAAVIEEQRGDLQTAADDLRQALDLTSDSSQQQRYRNKFAQLAHSRG